MKAIYCIGHLKSCAFPFFQHLKSFFTRQKQKQKQNSLSKIFSRFTTFLSSTKTKKSFLSKVKFNLAHCERAHSYPLYKLHSYARFTMPGNWRAGRSKSFNWNTSLMFSRIPLGMYTWNTTIICIIHLGLNGKTSEHSRFYLLATAVS